MAEDKPKLLEAGGCEVATAAGGARRYRKPLASFRWRDIQAITAESFSEWKKHKAPRLGAALGFYTLLSMAPLLLILVSVVGLVLGRESAEAGVVNQVAALVGPDGARAAQSLLKASRHTSHGIIASTFGLLTLLFGASGVLIELRDALNTIWDVPTPDMTRLKEISAFVRERLFSFALVLVIGFLLLVSLAVSAWMSALMTFSESILPAHAALLYSLNFVISFCVITGLFSAIYKFVPDVQIEWRDVILGGAVTSVLFTLGKIGLGIYLGRATFASTYGAAASIVVLIVWVYYSAQIFFLGAEFTRIFAKCYGSEPRAVSDMVVVGEAARPPVETPKVIVMPDDYRNERRSRQ